MITLRTENTNRLFADIKKIQRVDRQEEDRLIAEYKKTGCIAVRNRVINNNLLFAVHKAKSYVRHDNCVMSMEDLTSVCVDAMIVAIERFDPSRGFKFISYAVNWIRQHILTYIQRESRLIKQHSHAATIYKYMDILRSKNKEVTAENVHDLISTSESSSFKRKFSLETIKAVIDTMKLTSLDSPVHSSYDESSTQIDLVQDTSYMPDEGVEQSDIVWVVRKYVSILKPMERNIVVLFFGLGDELPRTLQEIGERFDMSRERVRQIKAVALKRLRKHMKKGANIQTKLFL